MADGPRAVRPAGSAGSIEAVFHGRIAQLPLRTRRLLLLAAADDVGDVADLRRAAEHLALDLAELDGRSARG